MEAEIDSWLVESGHWWDLASMAAPTVATGQTLAPNDVFATKWECSYVDIVASFLDGVKVLNWCVPCAAMDQRTVFSAVIGSTVSGKWITTESLLYEPAKRENFIKMKKKKSDYDLKAVSLQIWSVQAAELSRGGWMDPGPPHVKSRSYCSVEWGSFWCTLSWPTPPPPPSLQPFQPELGDTGRGCGFVWTQLDGQAAGSDKDWMEHHRTSRWFLRSPNKTKKPFIGCVFIAE